MNVNYTFSNYIKNVLKTEDFPGSPLLLRTKRFYGKELKSPDGIDYTVFDYKSAQIWECLIKELKNRNINYTVHSSMLATTNRVHKNRHKKMPKIYCDQYRFITIYPSNEPISSPALINKKLIVYILCHKITKKDPKVNIVLTAEDLYQYKSDYDNPKSWTMNPVPYSINPKDTNYFQGVAEVSVIEDDYGNINVKKIADIAENYFNNSNDVCKDSSKAEIVNKLKLNKIFGQIKSFIKTYNYLEYDTNHTSFNQGSIKKFTLGGGNEAKTFEIVYQAHNNLINIMLFVGEYSKYSSTNNQVYLLKGIDDNIEETLIKLHNIAEDIKSLK